MQIQEVLNVLIMDENIKGVRIETLKKLEKVKDEIFNDEQCVHNDCSYNNSFYCFRQGKMPNREDCKFLTKDWEYWK